MTLLFNFNSAKYSNKLINFIATQLPCYQVPYNTARQSAIVHAVSMVANIIVFHFNISCGKLLLSASFMIV